MTRSNFHRLALWAVLLGGVGCSDPEGQSLPAMPSPGGGTADNGGAPGTGGGSGASSLPGAGGGGGARSVDAATDGAASASDAGAPAPGAGGSNGSTGSGGAVGSGGAGGQGGFGGGLALPVTVTTHYFPSGWFGDAETMAAFSDPGRVPIKLKPSASDGPCAARVSGAAGQCMKVTYTPIVRDGGMVGYAGVALLGVGTPAQRVAQGATIISAQVAGAVGGELVDFTFGNAAADGFMDRVSSTLTTTWQEVKFSLAGVPYDRISSPFTWGTDSATPITFYYDNVQIK